MNTTINSSTSSSEPPAWKRFALATACLAAALVIALAVLGIYWPGRADDIPPVNIHARIERVLSNVLERPPEWDCTIVVGDSRAAYNIDSRALSTADCPATNYGYAAFSLAIARFLLDRAFASEKPPRAVVLVASEMVFGAGPMKSFDVRSLLGLGGWAALEDQVWRFRPARTVILGIMRTGLFIRSITRPGSEDADSHVWSSELGRWTYSETERRVFPSVATAAKELATHAREYYTRDNYAAAAKELDGFVREVRPRLRRLVILIPPAYPEVHDLAERIAPGKLTAFYGDIRAVAERHGLPLIDCSRSERCGLKPEHFADAVHLNAVGAAVFSDFLAGEMKSIERGEARPGDT